MAPAAKRTPAAATSGQVMVEAAVVFPLLLLVAIALVQFAIYQHAQNVVQAAAQDGARVAAAQAATSADGLQRARAMIDVGLGQAAEERSVRVEALPADVPDRVIVTVSARLRMILPWVPLTDPYLPLFARAQMAKERFRAQRSP